MGVLIGGETVTRFSYIEYQMLMVLLGGTMCVGCLAIEYALRRFQVLPLLFPGMFTIRAKKFFFFDLEVSDVAVGRKLQGQTKMLVRMTLCVVLSYLWQQCVLATSQMVGTEFPQQQCSEGCDCFASKLHMITFYTRQHAAVDCSNPVDFPSRVVVSCIRFVNPSATTWLMHLAIAHSVTLLNLKCYEVVVWLVGNSRKIRIFVGSMSIITLLTFFGLFFSGVLSEFVSSWLSFVMSFSVPLFLYVSYDSGKTLESLWRKDAERVHSSIEEHLNKALNEFEPSSIVDRQKESVRSGWVSSRAAAASKTARHSVNRITAKLPNILPTRTRTGLGQDSTPNGGDFISPQGSEPGSPTSPGGRARDIVGLGSRHVTV